MMSILGSYVRKLILQSKPQQQCLHGQMDCVRHNQVLGQMLEKTMAETSCNIDIAVSWCINAKNSLHNVHGFSPFQLVFGRNPRLPGILVDRPPALDKYFEH